MPRRQARIASDKIVASDTFTDDLTVTNDAAISGDLTVSGSVISSSLSVAGATTLTTASSGKLIYLDQSSAYTITLPEVADSDGVVFRFVTVDAGNFIIVINAPTGAPMMGLIINGAGGSNLSSGNANLEFETAAIPGDWAELRSNGTNWFVSGQCGASGGIQFGE